MIGRLRLHCDDEIQKN